MSSCGGSRRTAELEGECEGVDDGEVGAIDVGGESGDCGAGWRWGGLIGGGGPRPGGARSHEARARDDGEDDEAGEDAAEEETTGGGVKYAARGWSEVQYTRPPSHRLRSLRSK